MGGPNGPPSPEQFGKGQTKQRKANRFFNDLIDREFLAILEFGNTKETVSDQVPS